MVADVINRSSIRVPPWPPLEVVIVVEAGEGVPHHGIAEVVLTDAAAAYWKVMLETYWLMSQLASVSV